MTPKAKLEAWLKGRPKIIQQLLRKFPAGSKIIYQQTNQTFYVIGATEGGNLLVTPIDPSKEEDYDEAVAQTVPLCGKHLKHLKRLQ